MAATLDVRLQSKQVNHAAIADRPLQSTISNSSNICHAGQYIIIEHTKDHMLCTQHTQFSTVI